MRTLNKKSQLFFRIVSLVFAIFLLDIFIASAAWAPPDTGPTGGNPSGPINVASDQLKTGSLKIGGVNTLTNPSKVTLELGDKNTTLKGFLPPRMTSAQRNTLLAGADTSLEGLMIYNTTNKRYESFDGNGWVAVATSSISIVTPVADGPAFSVFHNNYGGASPGVSLPAGETVISFDQIQGPDGNNDPCIALGCSGGPYGFRISDSTFKPSVNGRYLLSGTVRVWMAGGLAGDAELRLYKDTNLIKQTVLRPTGSAEYVSMTVTAVVEANGSNVFQLRIYNPSSAGNLWLYGDPSGLGRVAFFTGSRVGNPLNIQPIQNVITGALGSNSQVAHFNNTGGVVGNPNFVFDSVTGNLGLGTGAPAHKLEVGGNIRLAGNTLFTNGSNSSYGAVTVRGAQGGYSGINFKDAAGNNQKTLMIHPTYSGIFNAADSGWDWYWNGNTLEYGNVPISRVTGYAPGSQFPVGSMMMWFGGPAVPAGWQYCDGGNGTPNMNGRFPFGTNYGGAGAIYSPMQGWFNVYPAAGAGGNAGTDGSLNGAQSIGGKSYIDRTSWSSGAYSGTYTTSAPQNGFNVMQLDYFTGTMGASHGSYSHPNTAGSYNAGSTYVTTMPPFAGVVFICKTS